METDYAEVLNAAPAVRDSIINDGDCLSVDYLSARGCDDATAAYQSIPVADIASLSRGAPSSASTTWTLLYDVMRVHKANVMFFQDHLVRIADSYQTVTHRPMSATLRKHVEDGLRAYSGRASARTDASQPANPPGDVNLKFLMWVHPESFAVGGMVLFFVKSFFPPAEWYQTGIRMAFLFNARRANPSAKVVQSALRARAVALQGELDVFEVLLVHGEEDHYLIPEGSRSNYFLISSENQLLCSAEEDILVGITLKAAREAAVGAGLEPVQHRKLNVRHLLECTAMVMLGTSPGVLPVREVIVYHDTESKAAFHRACDDLAVPEEVRQRVVTEVDGAVGTLRLPVPHPVATRLADAYLQKAQNS